MPSPEHYFIVGVPIVTGATAIAGSTVAVVFAGTAAVAGLTAGTTAVVGVTAGTTAVVGVTAGATTYSYLIYLLS